jgi:hypothetical protein
MALVALIRPFGPPSPAGGRRKWRETYLLPPAGEGAERSEADEGSANP